MSTMMNLRHGIHALTLIFVVAACAPKVPVSVPKADPEPSRIFINEVLAGGTGNNNLEFIELYNSGGEIVDLKGWSLSYRLATSEEDLIVIEWERSALIPPYGHFLLVRMGQDFGLSPDGYFDQGLNTSGGGLGLRNQDGELVDAVTWGKGPATLTEGSPAPALDDDQSLERRFGEEGGFTDNDDNLTDFALNLNPSPQNVTFTAGSDPGSGFLLEITAPLEVKPGSS